MDLRIWNETLARIKYFKILEVSFMFELSRCKYDFASDNINIFALVYDESYSMCGDASAMREANSAFYQDFSKFEERGSIAIAKAVFSENFSMSFFNEVSEFDTSYRARDNTALYEAIVEAGTNTIDYYKEIVKRLNVRPKITFLVFSDGGDNCGSELDYKEAKKMVKQLNSLDATTVFVAFRGAISDGKGEELGFSCTKNINSVRDLIVCMGTELSKSCKEQSKSAYSLKSEFFSKADKNSSEDSAEHQPILDDDFFNV